MCREERLNVSEKMPRIAMMYACTIIVNCGQGGTLGRTC